MSSKTPTGKTRTPTPTQTSPTTRTQTTPTPTAGTRPDDTPAPATSAFAREVGAVQAHRAEHLAQVAAAGRADREGVVGGSLGLVEPGPVAAAVGIRGHALGSGVFGGWGWMRAGTGVALQRGRTRRGDRPVDGLLVLLAGNLIDESRCRAADAAYTGGHFPRLRGFVEIPPAPPSHAPSRRRPPPV